MNDSLDISYLLDDDIDDDYNHIFAESMFMLNQVENEARLYRAYQEACCLENSNIEGLVQINEGVWQSIKNFFTKIWNGIVKMINKFLSRVDELIGGSQAWLEGNKEIIVNTAPVRDVDIRTWNYNIKALYAIEVNITAIGVSKLENQDKADELVCSKLYSTQYFKNSDKDSNLRDNIELGVKGPEQITRKSQELNFTDMFNYCVNFADYKKNIKDDIKKLDTIEKQLEQEVEKAYNARAAKLKELDNGKGFFNKNMKKVGDTMFNKTTKKNAKRLLGGSVKNNNESVYRDIGTSNYIVEAEIGKSKNNNTNNVESPNSYNNKVNSNMNVDSSYKSDKQAVGNAGADYDQDINKMKESVGYYFKACGNVLSEKCTLSVAIYKEFMQILRWHVGQVGNKSADKVADKATITNNNKAAQNKANAERLQVND